MKVERVSLRLSVWMMGGCLLMAASASSWAYTQTYSTVWETTPITSTTNQYQYWIFNTGERDYSETQTQISSNPVTIETHISSKTPLIMNYEIPILSEAGFNSIDQSTIYQPYGWSFEFVDPVGIWTNTTGNPLFDNPYRILHWYTNDMALGIAPTGDISGVTFENGCAYGGEVCGTEFGLQSVFSPILGPDQTSWQLEVVDFTFTTVFNPLPPVIGDPDLPFYSNGAAGGGVPVIAAVGPIANQVPEPASLGLFAAGFGAWVVGARKRRRVV